jgi:hypothetical protein
MKIFFMKINQKNNFINKIKKIINIIIKWVLKNYIQSIIT